MEYLRNGLWLLLFFVALVVQGQTKSFIAAGIQIVSGRGYIFRSLKKIWSLVIR